MRRTHAAFEFKPGALTVSTSVDEVLRRRQGVCQDFAYVVLSCQRYITLAAGTDCADVVPLGGVILGGGATHGMDVSMSLIRQG